ncbi:MAG: hypothetical protein ACI9TV_002322 [Sulfurimonas sp.]|jgi:hypothetical protein|uniref:tail fiber domain-containing protein n=1 Tax=Sulfurimonas sp. TaxID=2022749 RepID=UPI0039E4A4D6
MNIKNRLKLTTLSLATLFALTTAQANSDFIGYQGVAFDTGVPYINNNVSLKFTILKDDNTTVIYEETVSGVSTSAQGYFSHDIGSGTPTSTAFADISWSDNYNLQTEIDLSNGTSYTNLGIQEFKSVAYAKNGLSQFNTSATGLNANAMGKNTTASGVFSTAMGYQTTAVGSYSTAMGFDSNASGQYSTAMGRLTNASGFYATAMGYQTTALENYSTAMGYDTNASGHSSTAMGRLTNASGSYSIAMGDQTNASGTYSTAMGVHTEASATSSTAMGYYTNASAIYSTAMGRNTKASGDTSTAMGRLSTASGQYSTAIGLAANASGSVSIAMGNYTIADHNFMTTVGTFNTKLNTDAYFVVGNGTGTDDALRSDAFSVYSTGNATLAGTLTQSSDERLKENIIIIPNALEKITTIRGVYFNWRKEANRGDEKQIGVIAQDVEKEFPQLVKEDNSGYKSVSYTSMVGVTIEAIKELKKENDSLRSELQAIKDALRANNISIK